MMQALAPARRRLRRPPRTALLVWCGLITLEAAAEPLVVTVREPGGHPVSEAVVQLRSADARPEVSATAAVIDQVDKQFQPAVSVIPVGTAVSFPNRDDIKHHVYSFSPPKVFQLKLYHGIPAEPVVFDKAGLVTLGCNIHDGMIAHVYVVDAAHYALTDADGVARFPSRPAGAFQVEAWHYRMDGAGTTMAADPAAPPVSVELELSLLATAALPPPLD